MGTNNLIRCENHKVILIFIFSVGKSLYVFQEYLTLRINRSNHIVLIKLASCKALRTLIPKDSNTLQFIWCFNYIKCPYGGVKTDFVA